jgi:tRNA(Arg) A34 adenosine deaminase TadA
MTTHEIRMKALIDFTKTTNAVEPYGCSIYSSEGKLLISVTGNKYSPINHAEILAINQCAKSYSTIKWNTLILYTTGEPCCMCASACCWANLKEVVYATNIPFMISLWGIESPKRAIDVMKSHPKVPSIIGGVCEEESNKMFVERQNDFAQTCEEHRWL